MCYSMAEIEEQELRETKRACNFIWAAAENYELEPLFLAFASNGTADMYLNLIIGLTYKWYDQEKIDDFLISWEEKTGNCMKVFFGSDLRMHCTKKKEK